MVIIIYSSQKESLYNASAGIFRPDDIPLLVITEYGLIRYLARIGIGYCSKIPVFKREDFISIREQRFALFICFLKIIIPVGLPLFFLSGCAVEKHEFGLLYTVKKPVAEHDLFHAVKQSEALQSGRRISCRTKDHALFEHLHGLVSIGKSVRPDAVKPTNEFRRRFRPENRIDEHDYIGGIDLLLLCKNIRSNFRIIL